MRGYVVRIWLTDSRWLDSVIQADTWFNAQSMGLGQSPVNRAQFLYEA
jgi:hypothetical protein